MTQPQRYADFQTDEAGLTLTEALLADAAGTLDQWYDDYWYWVKTGNIAPGNPPGISHPPHKPPF